jgi:formylglycine-generating enzyme required for sulfatase activity
MMRVVSAIVLAVCSMWLICQPAFAEKRIALVIGNSAYERAPRLANPANDANTMSEMFKRAGFDTVELKLDLKASEMRRALRDFSDDARYADIAIIYFAGHGLEIQGTNYLVPTDAVLERDVDAYDEAVSLDRLLSVIEPAKQLRLVILDACRDNPFIKSMKHAIASRAVERGLAKVEPIEPNTLVAFAAKAGSTADDGDTTHSPFTAALVKYLPQPGLDLRRAFGYVRDDVLKMTRNRQEPFIYGSLGGDDFPLVPAPAVAAPAPAAPVVDPNTVAREDYELAAQINVVSAWESYIKKYPTGFYSDLARVQRDELLAKKAAATEQARLAAEKMAANEAKAAEEARIKAVQAAAQSAAILPGDGRLGQEASGQQGPASGCAGTKELVSLSPAATRALSLPEECALKPKNSFRECQNCPEMVVVPAGEFLMGSGKDDIDNELAAANEAPQHKVRVKETIAIGRFEVTRDQFAAFVNSTGRRSSGRCMTFEHNVPKERENRSFLVPGYAQDGNHPAVCVSWTDAQAYADWLSKTTGKTYRLPSEAEFEYAARAGGTARYGFTDDPADLCRFANGADQSAKTAGLPPDAPYMACSDGYPFTAPVGSFAANAFGLHDLIGNVWEWTADCFADDYRSAGADSAPRNAAGCTARTVRGGDWFSTPSTLRPAVRAKANQDAHNDDIGFRVVRILAH